MGIAEVKGIEHPGRQVDQLPVMRRGQHDVKRRRSFRIQEQLLQYPLARGDALDRISAAKQFIQQKQVRPDDHHSRERVRGAPQPPLCSSFCPPGDHPPSRCSCAHGIREPDTSDAKHVLIVCASTALTPTVLRKVDFPDMLEPVTSTPRPKPETRSVRHRILHERMAEVARTRWVAASEAEIWATPIRAASAPGRDT